MAYTAHDFVRNTHSPDDLQDLANEVATLANAVSANVKDSTYGAKGDYVYATTAGTDDTTAIQNAINAVSALGGGTVYFPRGYYKITAALTVPSSVSLRGEGVFPLYGSLAQGFQAVNLPYTAPHLGGSVIVQTTAATDGIQCTGLGAATNLHGIGVLFASAIQFTNTGHGIWCRPAVYSAAYDHGLMGAQWDNVMVYGHDGNHYAFYLTNQLYCTWGTVKSWGGGGIYMENNTDQGFDYGNFRADHVFCMTFVNGTAHVYRFAVVNNTNKGVLNILSFGRMQAMCFNVGSIGAVTPTAPAATQYLVNFDSTIQYVSVEAPDWETGSTGNPVLLPTAGNLFLGSGAPGFSSNGTLQARPIIEGDLSNKQRQLMNDMALRTQLAEASGSTWDLFRGPAKAAITVPTDGLGSGYVRFPGTLINRAGPTGDRPTGLVAGAEFFDTTLGKPIWYTGSGWVDSAAGAVAAAAGGASVASDTFTRSNSTTTLGTCETGQIWLTNSTFGISTNAGYNPAATSPVAGNDTANESLAWLVTNVSDCTISCTLATVIGALETGLCVRLADGQNFWRLTSHGIRKVVNGTAQTQTVFSSNFASADVMAVVLSGSSITVKKNGSTVATVSDAFNQTATAHGLRSFNDNGGSRWDSFAITL